MRAALSFAALLAGLRLAAAQGPQSPLADIIVPPLGQGGPISGRLSPFFQPPPGVSGLAVAVYVRTPAGAFYGPKPSLPGGFHPVTLPSGDFSIPEAEWASAHLDLSSDVCLCLIDIGRVMASGQSLPLALGTPTLPANIEGMIGGPACIERTAMPGGAAAPGQALRGGTGATAGAFQPAGAAVPAGGPGSVPVQQQPPQPPGQQQVPGLGQQPQHAGQVQQPQHAPHQQGILPTGGFVPPSTTAPAGTMPAGGQGPGGFGGYPTPQGVPLPHPSLQQHGQSVGGKSTTVGGKSVGGAGGEAGAAPKLNLWGEYPPPGSSASGSKGGKGTGVGGASVGGKSVGGGGGKVSGKAAGDGQARVTLTAVPPIGQSGDIKGRIEGITPSNQRVGCYIQMPGGAIYGPKPSILFPVQSDNTFNVVNCIMNDSDRGADIVIIIAFESGAVVPPVVGAAIFPPEVTTRAIAQTTYSRASGSSTTQATGGGSRVGGQDVAGQVPWPPGDPGGPTFPAGGFINFAGYRWVVKDSGGAPVGPADNVFSAKNIWTDNAGLHNVYAPTGGGCEGWAASEVFLDRPLGYGTYLIRTVSPADTSLDALMVSSPFFLWADDPDGNPQNGFKEIDVEVSKWGWAEDMTAGQFVLRPLQAGGMPPNWKVRFPMSQLRAASGSGSGVGGCNNQGPLEFNGAAVFRVTHVVKFFSRRLQWYSFDGLYTLSSLPQDQGKLIASFSYPPENGDWVPTAPSDARVHINLWNIEGKSRPPGDGRRVHSITAGFEFTPQDIPLSALPASHNLRMLLEEPQEGQPRVLQQQQQAPMFAQQQQPPILMQGQQWPQAPPLMQGQQYQQQQPPQLQGQPLPGTPQYQFQQQQAAQQPMVGLQSQQQPVGQVGGQQPMMPPPPTGTGATGEAAAPGLAQASSGDHSGEALKKTLSQMGLSSPEEIIASAEKAIIDSLPDWAIKAAHEAGGVFIGPDGMIHKGSEVSQGISARSVDLKAGDSTSTAPGKTGGLSKNALLALTIGGGLLAVLVLGVILLFVTYRLIRGGKKLPLISGTGGKGWARLDEEEKEQEQAASSESMRRVPPSSLSSSDMNQPQQQQQSERAPWYSFLASKLGRNFRGNQDKGSPTAYTPSGATAPAYSSSVYADRKASRHSRFAKYLDQPSPSESKGGPGEGAGAPRLGGGGAFNRPSPLGIGESGRAFQPAPSPTASSTINPHHQPRNTPTSSPHHVQVSASGQPQQQQQQRRFWSGPQETEMSVFPSAPRKRSGSQIHV